MTIDTGMLETPVESPSTSHRMAIAMLVGMMAIRMGVMLLVIKVLSTLFGPSQFGALTQIMGVSAIFYSLAGGGVTNGLIRYVAAERAAPPRLQWLAAAAAICIVSSGVLALVSIGLYFFGAQTIFLDPALAPVFLVIGAAQIVVGAGNVALSYLSGKGELGHFALANVAGNLVALLVTLTLALAAGYAGASYGAAILPLGPALLGIAMLVFTRTSLRLPRPRWPQMAALLKFAAVMVIAATAVPLAQLYLRPQLAGSDGWAQVGYWQAISRLSDAYMQVFGVLFINLLLPRLAATSGRARTTVLLQLGGSYIGLFLLGAAGLLVLQNVVVRVAFSPEFGPAMAFIPAQLTADFAKIAALVFIYYFLARGTVWIQGAAELFQAGATIALYLVLQPALGPLGVVVAQAIACVVLLLALAAIFTPTILRERREP